MKYVFVWSLGFLTYPAYVIARDGMLFDVSISMGAYYATVLALSLIFLAVIIISSIIRQWSL